MGHHSLDLAPGPGDPGLGIDPTPRLARFIATRPAAAFLGFAVLHVAVWTALPTLLYPNLPLDLIEALTYGREWQLGYDKLPPLPWWLVEMARYFVGTDVAYYALAELSVMVALAAVWAMARKLVGPVGALAAVLIVDGLHFFHYTAVKFNHDVVELPFWAIAGWAFWASLRQGKTASWLVLAVSLGFAFWAKYFVLVLAVPLLVFLLIDRSAQPALKTLGPWLAVGMVLVIMSPHLVWLGHHQFLPFAYANARAVPPRSAVDYLFHPAEFVASQVFFLIPSGLIATPLWWPRRAQPAPRGTQYDQRIVAVLAFGPAATVIAGSLLTGRAVVAMWGYPLWLFLGLWIVITGPGIDPMRLRYLVGIWAVVFIAYMAAFVGNYSVLPHYDHRYRAVLFPGAQLATTLVEKYREATGLTPAYVIASMWVGGNIAHYAPDHPRVLIDGDPRRAPWIDLLDLSAHGAVVVWIEGDPTTTPAKLEAWTASAQMQPPFALVTRGHPERVEIGWAIVPPSAPP
jgi:4-amino-4-deoxy-L-arabinose transferase-like glycosyltransferase